MMRMQENRVFLVEMIPSELMMFVVWKIQKWKVMKMMSTTLTMALIYKESDVLSETSPDMYEVN